MADRSGNTLLPDFFVAGAPRSGTTTLYHALRAHPDVYMSPVKEPHFFSRADLQPERFRESLKASLAVFDFDAWLGGTQRPFLHRWYVDSWEQYVRLFEGSGAFRRRGEASTSYLWSAHAAAAIRERIPGARIVISLRHPVERAFSHYLMERRMNVTTKSFHDHLAEDAAGPVRAWGATSLYVETGLYYNQVKRYIDTFGRDNVHVSLLEDLAGNPDKLMRSLFAFLEVEPTEAIDFARYNEARLPRFSDVGELAGAPAVKRVARRLPDAIRRLARKLLYRSPLLAMAAEDRAMLLGQFRDDTRRLQDLIQRDLSAWLK